MGNKDRRKDFSVVRIKTMQKDTIKFIIMKFAVNNVNENT